MGPRPTQPDNMKLSILTLLAVALFACAVTQVSAETEDFQFKLLKVFVEPKKGFTWSLSGKTIGCRLCAAGHCTDANVDVHHPYVRVTASTEDGLEHKDSKYCSWPEPGTALKEKNLKKEKRTSYSECVWKGGYRLRFRGVAKDTTFSVKLLGRVPNGIDANNIALDFLKLKQEDAKEGSVTKEFVYKNDKFDCGDNP